MNAVERPVIRCLVALEMKEALFTSPALVSLELAAEMKDLGYAVIGSDPEDEQALATYERRQPWFWRLDT